VLIIELHDKVPVITKERDWLCWMSQPSPKYPARSFTEQEKAHIPAGLWHLKRSGGDESQERVSVNTPIYCLLRCSIYEYLKMKPSRYRAGSAATRCSRVRVGLSDVDSDSCCFTRQIINNCAISGDLPCRR
jgi:hypothetical protein